MNRRAFFTATIALLLVASVAFAAPKGPAFSNNSKAASTAGYVQRQSGLWVPAKYQTAAPKNGNLSLTKPAAAAVRPAEEKRLKTTLKVQTAETKAGNRTRDMQTKAIEKSASPSVGRMMTTSGDASHKEVWHLRKGAGDSYNTARKLHESSRLESQQAASRFKTSGNPADRIAAMQAGLTAGRAKVDMIQAQVAGLRAKAQGALGMGDAKKANLYQDRADTLSARAVRMTSNLNTFEGKIKSGAATPAGTVDLAAAARPIQAADTEKAPGVDAPQAKRGQVYQVGKYRDLSLKPTAAKASYGRVKEQAGANDFDGAYRTLQAMEAKAEGSHGLTGAWRSFQVSRAKRTLRNEAGRMVKDGATDYARTIEQPRLNVRMAAATAKSQLVHDNHMSPTDARQVLREQMQGVGAALPAKNKSTFIQAERVLTQLSRVEQKHQNTFSKRLLGTLGGLAFGSATRALHQANRDVVKQAERLAKQGPEGVISAHLLMQHARTREPSLAAKQGAMLGKAMKNLDRTIKDTRKSGDVGSLALAYNAKETLRMDNPQDQDLARKVDRDLTQYRADMHKTSLVALKDLTEHAAWLSSVKEDAGAKQFMGMVTDIKAKMADEGLNVPRKLAKQIAKVDDHVNGRDRFGYKWRTRGALGKAALVAGAVVKAPFKVAYGTAKFAVKAVTFPVWGPYKWIKNVARGQQGPQPPKMDQQTAVQRIQDLGRAFNVGVEGEGPQGGPEMAGGGGMDRNQQMAMARQMMMMQQQAAGAAAPPPPAGQ